MCEFINAVPSQERWTIDIIEEVRKFAAPEVKLVIDDVLIL